MMIHRRKSVSAVTARLPSTISLIHRGGTLMARAKPFRVSPMGLMNSSSRIRPASDWAPIQW
jgi:hypothetical protein